MAGRVAGKVAIVTGAASGIGRAAAGRLVEEGALVVVADVDEAGGQRAVDELGGVARFAAHDVRDEASWQRLVARTLEDAGRLDVLVNNAGIVIAATIEETTVEQLQRIHDVNVRGVLLGCKHAIPAMRAGGGGSIVNLSSLAGLRGTPPYAAYSASKGAVLALTRTVAAHCALRGDAIRCNSVHPGGVDTPMVRGLLSGRSGGEPPSEAALAGLMGARDVAELIVFLASDASRFVNGAEIAIDAGSAAIPGLVVPPAPR